MPDIQDLMGRFGDVEFLHELWSKARLRLPEEIEQIDSVLTTATVCPDPELYVQIHRIRGAIGNFFNKSSTLDQLVLCENLTKNGTLDSLRHEWSLFKTYFQKDSRQLEDWLLEQGFTS